MHPFFKIFNKNRPFINPDSSKWPREWKEIRFKSYPRFEKIILPKPDLDEKISLKETILKRRTRRNFSEQTYLNLNTISNLLSYSAGITYPKKIPIRGKINKDKTRRAYPSGGARYPLEIYLAVFRVKDLVSGLYHYNVLEHSLEKILTREVLQLKQSFQNTFIEKSEALILISALIQRSYMKYGNLAYKLILLEAGHLAQNVSIVSEALSIKSCALGDFDKDLVHQLLDIDGINETVFYALALGH